MKRQDLAYYRDERTRLVERQFNVGREQTECRTRLAELQDESALLGELLNALDAHVPEADDTAATDAVDTSAQHFRYPRTVA